MFSGYPVAEQRWGGVASTSVQRHGVASALLRRCVDAVCPLGMHSLTCINCRTYCGNGMTDDSSVWSPRDFYSLVFSHPIQSGLELLGLGILHASFMTMWMTFDRWKFYMYCNVHFLIPPPKSGWGYPLELPHRNESEETEEIKYLPLSLPATRTADLAQL